MSCFDLSNDHSIALSDLHDERRAAILMQLLNGKCTSTPFTPSCKLLTRDRDPSVLPPWFTATSCPQSVLIPLYISE